MNKVSIYVIAHKNFSWKPKKGYTILGVGNQQEFADEHDYIGDNISSKNPNYCELSGLYWIWKNVNSPIIGLVHYRRFFTTNIFSNSPKYFVSENRIEKILRKKDIILSPYYHFKKTIEENREEFCYKKDLIELRRVLKSQSPEYLDTFDYVFLGHRSYLCNMFIAKKEIVDKYCSWLFRILFELERRIDTSGYQGNKKRVYGYLSEVLLTVYIKENKLKVKSMPIAATEVNFWERLKKKVGNGLLK